MNGSCFDPALRELKQLAFSVEGTSTAGFTIPWNAPALDGRSYRVYGNANCSIYSAASCNGDCPFCVEKVRPASRGSCLADVKRCIDDHAYFTALDNALHLVRPLDPSISITGGEPSIDPRLPRIIALVQSLGFRKRTITTNGSGLLRNGLVPVLAAGGFEHLNISRAHVDEARNQAIMQLDVPFPNSELRHAISLTRGTCLRPRLSCVLLRGEIDCLDAITTYLDWAESIGVDNVVFRQLMAFDPARCAGDPVIAFSERYRVGLDPILNEIYQGPAEHHRSFTFTKQVVGYYYYIEVYKYRPARGKSINVVFENADLRFIDRDRQVPRDPPLVHELVFHPGGTLNSSWLPAEGIIARLV
ncbi:MAG: radical SAM protein [Candidatus Lokiarchaeota archaeon]|nr:radical SAM protein [Candidatus Lokiarchaeota archaeon]